MESDAFHNLMHILRPSYKLPSRKELAGSLLDSVHTEVEKSIKETLKGREGTLIIDGWSNIHNKPITASCVEGNRKSCIVDMGANKDCRIFIQKMQ